MNQLINDKAIYRTASATPGLLNISYSKLWRSLTLCALTVILGAYPKLWRQLPIGVQRLRVGAHKFRVGYLIFDNIKNNVKAI